MGSGDDGVKIAIVGSREFADLKQVRQYVEVLAWEAPVDEPRPIIVTGGAKGVDRAAEAAAGDCKLETIVYPADWARYGKSAGYRRNHRIVQEVDHVVAFWDGTSKGTKHTIDLALANRVSLEVFFS